MHLELPRGTWTTSRPVFYVICDPNGVKDEDYTLALQTVQHSWWLYRDFSRSLLTIWRVAARAEDIQRSPVEINFRTKCLVRAPDT